MNYLIANEKWRSSRGFKWQISKSKQNKYVCVCDIDNNKCLGYITKIRSKTKNKNNNIYFILFFCCAKIAIVMDFSRNNKEYSSNTSKRNSEVLK